MQHDPWQLFSAWLDAATATEPRVPEAMQIATIGTDGMPSLRTVLLKDHDPRGLTFYTNLGSQKARELQATPRAAFLLHYKGLERQVRGEGTVTPVADEEADAYWATRPRGSQVGAWASRQSTEIAGRDELLAAVAEMEARFAGVPVPRPPFWSGFRIAPTRIEFWQGHADRLHDRQVFTREGGGWRRTLLAP
ncbi:MAG: pyridoxamine 5'-phosphate oxidase [Alphaproteobacteria bacterium]|nr:pyridoxamine 5'-phosphate oxidase [Alphaproteobacteria bacterium]MCB9691455.1 pyridoxamine 5'-phosphate oxidase [Alphaproteobacteria bacterium]